MQKEIWGEDDLVGYYQLSPAEIVALSSETRKLVLEFIKNYNEVDWGCRVFRDKENNLVIVPDKDKWWNDEMRDCQVNVLSSNNMN